MKIFPPSLSLNPRPHGASPDHGDAHIATDGELLPSVHTGDLAVVGLAVFRIVDGSIVENLCAAFAFLEAFQNNKTDYRTAAQPYIGITLVELGLPFIIGFLQPGYPAGKAAAPGGVNVDPGRRIVVCPRAHYAGGDLRSTAGRKCTE